MISLKDVDGLPNDAFLPSQYISLRASGAREGAFLLWYHVLDYALFHDLFSPKENLRRNTRQWFESRAVCVGSFVWICQMLDLPAGILRDAVLRLEYKPKSQRRRGAAPSRVTAIRQSALVRGGAR